MDYEDLKLKYLMNIAIPLLTNKFVGLDISFNLGTKQ